MDTNDDTPPMATIRKDGDTVLQAKNGAGKIIAQYRVSSAALMEASKYYHKLVHSEFNEGPRFRQRQEELHRLHQDLTQVPIFELPVMAIPLPEGVTQEKVILTAVKLFLKAVHLGQHTQQEQEDREFLLHALSSDINLFAHVVALSDQLDAIHVVRHVAEQVLEVQPMCQKRPKKGDTDSERYWRQLLYIAYLYKHSKAFRWISGTLITYGFDGHDSQNQDAPWHNLPNHIQDEMIVRRDGIFNTISSIPNSLLKPYMQSDKSRPAICKLGYGNSIACDSFQLGESIRWLCRRKFASPNLAMFYATPEEESFAAEGTPKAMIKALREFPDYQIDGHHHRCGIKGKLTQILDSLELMLSDAKQLGLCVQCWCSNNRDHTSWSMERRPNALPYKGNLAKDFRTVQDLRTKFLKKPASPKPQQNLRKEILEDTDDIVGDSEREVQNPTLLPDEAEMLSQLPTGIGIGITRRDHVLYGREAYNPVCPYVLDHMLYAKAFTAERWTEKEWLTGDETIQSDVSSNSSPGRIPKR